MGYGDLVKASIRSMTNVWSLLPTSPRLRHLELKFIMNDRSRAAPDACH